MKREDGKPTIGLALIVRNEAETLPKLLDSVGWTELLREENRLREEVVADPAVFAKERSDLEPEGPCLADEGTWRKGAAVDFVVVCDTGSTDKTKRVAEQRGCKVIDFGWCDDFSAARQASYDALPDDVDWTLWADADDILEGAERLRDIAASSPPTIAGHIFKYDYAHDPAGNCICELWRERLVRNVPGCRWKLPIHEVLEVPGPLVHNSEVIWHHVQPEGRERDPERNYRILKADYEKAEAKNEDPDPRTLAYLGTEALALGRQEEAEGLFRAYLLRPDATFTEERCQVAHKLSVALRQMADQTDDKATEEQLVEAAAQAAFQATQERPDWPDGYLDLAEIALRREHPERCLQWCEIAERQPTPQTLLIINPLEYAYQPLLMRSVALAKMGRAEEAFEETQKALQITPYREDLMAQAAGVARDVKVLEAKRHFLALRELLVRHDENEKAAKLMECAPYFVWGQPEVAQARLDQREMTLHAVDPETYSSYYRENPGETPFEMQGVPIEEAHERFHRVKFLRESLAEVAKTRRLLSNGTSATYGATGTEDLRILDLSANDGWMLANLHSGGFGTSGRLDGMDLNAGAAERAQNRMTGSPSKIVCADLHTAPEHFDEGTYDAVVLFETIEHVPDPAATVALCCRMVRPGGRVYISTPNGAFEAGNIPDWARVESKGHLRAIRPHDLSALLCERGIVHNFAMEQGLLVAELEPKPRASKIVFYAGAVDALPEKILEEGLGGSETALCRMAEQLARRGHDVRVYAGAGGGLRGDHVASGEQKLEGGNVLYAPATEWDPAEPCDLFVSSRIPEAADRTISAPRRLLWLHDADYGDRLTETRAQRFTEIAVLSEFQAELLGERYPFIAEKLWITRNGIDTALFEVAQVRRKPWVVYSSSPDRGLDVLLELWPEIRRRAIKAGVKDPQLHHCYAPVYGQFREAYPHLKRFHERLEQLGEDAGEGVVAHPAMGQRDLAELYCTAQVWAYPSWTTPTFSRFPEISCISAMEAQAAGCVPVYAEHGALTETVAAGLPVEPTFTGVEGVDAQLNHSFRETFVEAVVEALTDSELRTATRKVAQPHAMGLDWTEVAEQWEDRLIASPEPQEVAA